MSTLKGSSKAVPMINVTPTVATGGYRLVSGRESTV